MLGMIWNLYLFVTSRVYSVLFILIIFIWIFDMHKGYYIKSTTGKILYIQE